MKTTQLLGLGLIAYALLNRKPAPQQLLQQLPPKPAGNYQTNYAQWLAWAKNAYAQAKNVYGSGVDLYNALFGPGGLFAGNDTPSPGSNYWDETTNGDNGEWTEWIGGIGRVYKNHPGGYPIFSCNDLTFTDKHKRGACSHHRGL